MKEKDIPFTIASASIKEILISLIESFGLDRWIKPEDIVYDDGTYENKIAMFHKAADVIGIDMKDIRFMKIPILESEMHMMQDVNRSL